jgi:hypothetical protein
VLADAPARAALVERLQDVDRLVLLGDTVELRQGPTSEMLQAAVSVLRELGAALGPEKEVVIVPGNHDHRLLAPWRERRAVLADPPALGLESELDWRSDEPLGALAGALAPARVRATYPGVWLREDIYAIHGHYVDRHMSFPILERLGAGVMDRLMGKGADAPAGAAEYEAVLAPMYDWLDTVFEVWSGVSGGLQVRVWRSLRRRPRRRTWRQHGAALSIPVGVAVLNRLGLGPLGSDLSAAELRRAGLRAFGQVLDALGVRAGHAIFGHTHRAGPLPGDEPGEWTSSGGISIMNTGSWVRSPELIGDSTPESPYRPGFAILVPEEGAPELLNLLDRAEPQRVAHDAEHEEAAAPAQVAEPEPEAAPLAEAAAPSLADAVRPGPA